MRRSSRLQHGTVRQRGRKTVAYVLLSGSLLVSSIAPSMAEDYRGLFWTPAPLPGPSSAQPERSSDNSAAWGLGVVAVAVIGCAFLGCFDSDDEAPASGESNRRASDPPSRRAEQDADPWDNVPPISPFYGDRTAPQVYGQ